MLPVQRPDRALLRQVIDGLLTEKISPDEVDSWHMLVTTLDATGPSLARVPQQPEDGGWIFISLGLLGKTGAYLGAPEDAFIRTRDLEEYKAELERAAPTVSDSPFQHLRRHRVSEVVDTPLVIANYPALHRLPALGVPMTRWAGDKPALREQALFAWHGLVFEVTRSLDEADMGRTVLSSSEVVAPPALAAMLSALGLSFGDLGWFRADYRLPEPMVILERAPDGSQSVKLQTDNTLEAHLALLAHQRAGLDCSLSRPN